MKVVLTPRAQRDLEGLRRRGRGKLSGVLLERITRLSEGFEGYDVKRLEGASGKLYRVRLADYRVLVEWAGDELSVLRVVNRKDAY